LWERGVESNIKSLENGSLADIYGMPLHSPELVSKGLNVTFKISSNPGEFYLRLYRGRGRTRQAIDAEIAALLAFRPADEVYVAKPQKLRAGGYIFSCPYKEETRLACLFAAARGREAANDTGDMRQFGAALAVMHRQMNASVACGRPFLPAEVIGEAVRRLSQRGSQFRHLCRKIKHVGALIEANLNGGSTLRRGFCHGDAWLANIRISGPRTTFFDFDNCFDGPLVADLVPQIAWLWQATRLDFPVLARVLLDAYASLLPLSDADLAAIPLLVQLHEICSIAFLVKHCFLEPVVWAECLDRSARMLDDWSPGGAASAYISPLTGVARIARTQVA
jgi:Ser/Thr protein kinase RdoA (MazF antagonist)